MPPVSCAAKQWTNARRNTIPATMGHERAALIPWTVDACVVTKIMTRSDRPYQHKHDPCKHYQLLLITIIQCHGLMFLITLTDIFWKTVSYLINRVSTDRNTCRKASQPRYKSKAFNDATAWPCWPIYVYIYDSWLRRLRRNMKMRPAYLVVVPSH